MPEDKLPPIPLQQSVTDSAGKIDGGWSRWLNQLARRAEVISSVGSIDASAIVSGVLAIARIPSIPWANVLKAGSSLADLTTRSASDLSSGLLALARGGTAANLSATGGTSQYLKQTSAGAAVSVGTIAAADLPTGIDAAKIADGSVSNTEFQYLDAARQNLQMQVDQKWSYPPYRKSAAWMVANQGSAANSAVISLVGTVAPASVGTSSTIRQSGEVVTVRTTSAVVNNVARLNQTAGTQESVQPSWLPLLEMDVLTDATSIAGLYYFMGWYGSNSPPFNGTGTNSYNVAFRYLEGTDPGWMAITNDGTIANQTVTNLNTAIAANTRYRLKIIFTSAASVDFYINGVNVGTVTTALPASTNLLGVWLGVTNLSGVARAFGLSCAYWEWGTATALSSSGTITATPHNLLSATHPDTTAAAPVTGDLVVAQAGSWARFAVGATDRVLRVVAGLPSWSTIVDAMVDASAAIGWSKISKTGSSLADLATRSASDLSSGTLATARGGTSVDIASAALPLGSGQITFPATQNPAAGVNVLDDYEEGSWTPVIGGTGGTTGQTYAVQTGRYTKIGKLVAVSFEVFLSNKGTITGNVQIEGLPFAAEGTPSRPVYPMQWSGLATNWVFVVGLVLESTSTLLVRGAQAAATSSDTSLTTADIANSTFFRGAAVYMAAN
jgi:hypothetical protein